MTKETTLEQVDGDWGDPIAYGGTFYDPETDTLLYFDGLDVYHWKDEEKDTFPFYCFCPMDKDDVTGPYSWVNLSDVRETMGLGEDEQYDLETKEGLIRVTLDIASYYGADNLDSYPLQLSTDEIRKQWGIE